jgi:hypothetical protein
VKAWFTKKGEVVVKNIRVDCRGCERGGFQNSFDPLMA